MVSYWLSQLLSGSLLRTTIILFNNKYIEPAIHCDIVNFKVTVLTMRLPKFSLVWTCEVNITDMV